MTETRTLQFDSPSALQSLYANDLKLLKTLEDSLGVKVTTREGWLKLEGEPGRIDKAQHVFEQLEEARQKGVDIQKHEFSYALNSVTEARDENLGDLASTKIVTSPRKSPIIARSAGQRNYVEAIQKHDIVFGIGPAGTGQNYLTVAKAIFGLKKQKTMRYVRPIYDPLCEMPEPEEIELLLARQTIEIAPLACIRGLTLNHAF